MQSTFYVYVLYVLSTVFLFFFQSGVARSNLIITEINNWQD
jgi:hypothetical protein